MADYTARLKNALERKRKGLNILSPGGASENAETRKFLTKKIKLAGVFIKNIQRAFKSKGLAIPAYESANERGGWAERRRLAQAAYTVRNVSNSNGLTLNSIASGAVAVAQTEDLDFECTRDPRGSVCMWISKFFGYLPAPAPALAAPQLAPLLAIGGTRKQKRRQRSQTRRP